MVAIPPICHPHHGPARHQRRTAPVHNAPPSTATSPARPRPVGCPPSHRSPAHSTGGFAPLDASPRRVAGVSHPYGRNSPHLPPPPRPRPPPATTRLATAHPPGHARPTQPPTPDHTQPQRAPTNRNLARPATPGRLPTQPPLTGPLNRGFCTIRRTATACRRRVAPLVLQFPHSPAATTAHRPRRWWQRRSTLHSPPAQPRPAHAVANAGPHSAAQRGVLHH